jgi:hypothetical protein
MEGEENTRSPSKSCSVALVQEKEGGHADLYMSFLRQKSIAIVDPRSGICIMCVQGGKTLFVAKQRLMRFRPSRTERFEACRLLNPRDSHS